MSFEEKRAAHYERLWLDECEAGRAVRADAEAWRKRALAAESEAEQVAADALACYHGIRLGIVRLTAVVGAAQAVIGSASGADEVDALRAALSTLDEVDDWPDEVRKVTEAAEKKLLGVRSAQVARVEAERDAARAEVERRGREHEALVETAQRALGAVAAERDAAIARAESAEHERDLAKSLHDVAVRQRDARAFELSECERARDRAFSAHARLMLSAWRAAGNSTDAPPTEDAVCDSIRSLRTHLVSIEAEVGLMRATAEREAASSPNGADRAEAAERALAFEAVLELFRRVK